MKRDMNLVRSILLTMEEHEHGRAPRPFTVEGFSEEEVGYHIHLMGQAGLLKVAGTTSMSSPSPKAIPVYITWDGHEFLDLSREPSRWKQAVAKIKDTGGAMTISILSDVLLALAKKALAIP